MNSSALTVRALDGRATPKVMPPAEIALGTGHVSKMIPVSGSVYLTGVPLCAEVEGRTVFHVSLQRSMILRLLILHGTTAANEAATKGRDLMMALVGCRLRSSTGTGQDSQTAKTEARSFHL